MEYGKCYRYTPKDARPAKRRRIEETGQGLQASWPLRRQAYRAAWQDLETDISIRLESINAATAGEVTNFLDEVHRLTEPSPSASGQTPAGFILAGPNSTLYASLVAQLSSPAAKSAGRLCIPISSSAAGPNFKSLLKAIIRTGTSQTHDAGNDDDDELEPTTTTRRGAGPRLLNYDLEILHLHARAHGITQVVLALADTEAFDSGALAELIALVTSWQDRIPLVLLFHVATSLAFLQQRLPGRVVRCLGLRRQFDAAQVGDEVEQVFAAITRPRDTRLWLGPNVAGMLLQRQRDYAQSIEALVEGVRLAYMGCWYANALSLFLGADEMAVDEVPADHCRALRNLPSFRAHIEQLLEDGKTADVRELLDSDVALFAFARNSIADGHTAMAQLLVATEALRVIQRALLPTPSPAATAGTPGASASQSQPPPPPQPQQPIASKTHLYIQATSGTLHDSPFLRNLLLATRKAPSDVILIMMRALVALDAIPEDIKSQGEAIYAELEELIQGGDSSTSDSIAADSTTHQPLRSADAPHHATTLRTTVIAKKIALQKSAATLSAQDTAYTELLRRFTDLLGAYFTSALTPPPKSRPLHEVWMYDLRAPVREMLQPRPRAAVERALARPGDYLDCVCCASSSATEGKGEKEGAGLVSSLAPEQPGTALLYQLYLESGGLINVADLWAAFWAVVGGGARRSEEDGGEEEDEEKAEEEREAEEKKAKSLFQRGLAELRYLGFVKSTRRRVDHVAKVAWKGL